MPNPNKKFRNAPTIASRNGAADHQSTVSAVEVLSERIAKLEGRIGNIDLLSNVSIDGDLDVLGQPATGVNSSINDSGVGGHITAPVVKVKDYVEFVERPPNTSSGTPATTTYNPLLPLRGNTRVYEDKNLTRLMASENREDWVPVIVRERARVYNSVPLAIPNAAQTVLTFDSERFDSIIKDEYYGSILGTSPNLHSVTANTSRFTIPTNYEGCYFVGGTVRFAADPVGERWIIVLLNGATVIAIHSTNAVAALTTDLSIATFWNFNAGDYVELAVYQTSGAPLNVLSVGSFSPEFWIARYSNQVL